MPIDLRNIGSIAPNGTGTIAVPGSVDITGTPAPQYLINGVPIGAGGVTSISPGGLTGAVTLQPGANVSITQAGQAITIASTGGGSGSSQWIDIAGGGIYYAGGNVGIGTALPPAPLAVEGSGADAQLHVIGANAAKSAGLYVGGNLGTLPDGGFGITRRDAATGNWEATLFTLNLANGNVGIRTMAAQAALHVTDSSTGPQIVAQFENSDSGVSTSEARIAFGQNGNWWEGISGQYNNGDPSLVFSTSIFPNTWTERMRIDSSGNVGIGTDPAMPAARLHIVGSSALNPSLTERSPAAWILGNAFGGELAAGILQNSPFPFWLQARAAGNPLNLVLNPLGGNVGIGTTSPEHKLVVDGGEFGIFNSLPYCVGLSGSSASNQTWLGTDASANMEIRDTTGQTRYIFTQDGTAVIGSAPFDLGNPHLQAWGGAVITGMADNAIANLRLVGGNQIYGVIFRNDDSQFYLMATNAGDAYGSWSTPFPMQIDLATGRIGLRTAPNASYGVNVDSINAAALYINGSEVTAGGAGGQAMQPTGFRIPQNTVFYRPVFLGTTGLTLTVYLAKYGTTFVNYGTAAIEIGRGWYQLTYLAGDTNLRGPLVTWVDYAGGNVTFADEVVT